MRVRLNLSVRPLAPSRRPVPASSRCEDDAGGESPPSLAGGEACAWRLDVLSGYDSSERQRRSETEPKVGHHSAFSLVELLTVIAIIAVLASLFMTAVVSANKKSRTMVSTFNLRQISLALNLYLDDVGKRPLFVDEMVTGKYLTDRRTLLCPEDKTRNWGRLVRTGGLQIFIPSDGSAQPLPPANPVNYSYLLHPLSWDEVTWNRLVQEGGSAGVAACQLHGLGRQDVPNVRSFEGLLLRAQRDGAVVRRHIFWNSTPPVFVSPGVADGYAVGVNDFDDYPFQIYLDDPAEWFQTRPWTQP